MRKLLAVAVLVGLIVPAFAADPKPVKADEKKTSLKVGDAAPPLVVTKWLQGTEVKEFATGKVYVVEFWATWCGPCLVMMPHMGEMQAEYRDKGVTFIGLSAKDPNNTQEKVAALVEKRGPKLGYTFAYADDRQTYEAWMTASGQRGIPCCFVVGKDGKLAFIGHPLYLDVVLPKVVAGTWSMDDVEGMKKVEEDVNGVFKALNGDAEAGLKALAEFEDKHPKLADIPYFTAPRITMLIKARKTDEARKAAEGVIAKAAKCEDPMALRSVSAALRAPAAQGDKELLALSVKAAEAGVKAAGDKDPMALLNLADAHFAAGDKEKAKECGAKALAAAEKEPARTKQYIEMQIKKYDGEK